MPQNQPQRTRTMLVIISPEAGTLKLTAQPSNGNGLTLVNLCHQAIDDYDEQKRVLDAVNKSPAAQYSQLAPALQKAQEQHQAAQQTLSIIMNRLAEHFYAPTDTQTEPATDPEATDTAGDELTAVPPPEDIDLVAITKQNHSRLLSKAVPWITISLGRDPAHTRPTDYWVAMTGLLQDATTMLSSHDDIIRPQRRRSGKNTPNPARNPDPSITDNLMHTAEKTLTTFIVTSLNANW